MTAPIRHPETLLDRQRAGTLTEAERSELDAHLEHCFVCRLELQVGRGFEDVRQEAEPTDRSIEPAALDRIVGNVLDRLESPGGRTQRSGSHRVLSLSSRRRKVGAVVAIATFAVTAAAAAGYWFFESRTTDPETPRAVRPIERGVVPTPVQPRISPLPELESPQDAGGEPRLPDASPPKRPFTTPAPARLQVTATAAELFRQANRARRAGETAQAIRLYRALQGRFPESAEAKVSFTTLGQLLLHEQNPETALEQFDGYLESPSGTLGEEALIGRARALRRLHRANEERLALEQLLREYPSSMHGSYARQRLEQLRATTKRPSQEPESEPPEAP